LRNVTPFSGISSSITTTQQPFQHPKELFSIKTIAIDLDDTLNNFTETLQNTDFSYKNSYGISPEKFESYLSQAKQAAVIDTDLEITDFTHFCYQIHEQCYLLAKANTDGVRFMHWLKEHHWKIIICTHRDLRLSITPTKKWLKENDIPYDYLFSAINKIVFCKLWKIPYLIDDSIFNIEYGKKYGIQVYYPIMEKHSQLPADVGKGFHSFDEVKQWIHE
jgi:hypothetical protein